MVNRKACVFLRGKLRGYIVSIVPAFVLSFESFTADVTPTGQILDLSRHAVHEVLLFIHTSRWFGTVNYLVRYLVRAFVSR